MLLPFVGWHILSLSCFVTVTGHCWKRTSVPCLMKRSSCDHLHCDDQRCHCQPSPNFLETSLPKEKDKQFGIWEQDFCYFIAVSFAKWLKRVHNFKLSIAFNLFHWAASFTKKTWGHLNLSSRNTIVLTSIFQTFQTSHTSCTLFFSIVLPDSSFIP